MVRLGDIGQWSGGNTPSKANPAYWTDGTVPWVSPKDMKVDEIASSEDQVTTRALDEGRVSLVPDGSILIVTRSGILAHTLPVAVTKIPVTINQDLKALTPQLGYSSKYVALALKSASQQVLKSCSKHGTTVASVDTNALLNFEIPMVELAQQHITVAEIEKQFSRLDEAVANLQRVKANLCRYASVVRARAVKGALELEGAEGSDEELPQGWRWSFIGEIASVGTGATPSRSNAAYYEDGTVPWVTSSAVNEPFVDAADQFVTPLALAKTNLTLYPPGTLLVAMYGEGKTRGKCTELRISATTNQALAALQIDEPLRPWVKLFLEHNYQKTRGIATGGVQPNLNLSLVRSIRLPVPPCDEQHRIVAEIDRRLSIVRGVEAEVEANLKRAKALRQAVLQRAFAGELLTEQRGPSSTASLKLVPGTGSRRASASLVLSAEIVHRLHAEPTFGQRKHQKLVYLCEHIAGLSMIESQYKREAAGPADLQTLHTNEAALKAQGWYEVKRRPEGSGHHYRPLSQAGSHRPYLSCFTAEQLDTVYRLTNLMRTWATERCEIFSTTYAAWNDLILLGKKASDDAIVHEVWDLWDDSKRRFSQQSWREEIAWIRQQGFEPTGFGRPTRGPTQDMSPSPGLFDPAG